MDNNREWEIQELAKLIYAQNVIFDGFNRHSMTQRARHSFEVANIFYEVVDARPHTE